MANQLNQVPSSLEPIGRARNMDVSVSPVWYKFFTTLSGIFSGNGGSGGTGASAILDTIGDTVGGLLARFATGWHEFVASAPNQLLVMNPNAPPSLQTFVQLFNGNYGNARGQILFRGATGWQVLAPVAGQYLQSQGPGADPVWVTGVVGTSVATGLTATGSNQGDALALNANWSEITTAAANTGVLLFNFGAAIPSVVFNQGANAMNVYPPAGGKIDGLAVNAPYSLPAGKMQVFYQLTGTQWRSSQMG